MKAERPLPPLPECRIRAKWLLNQLRRSDAEAAVAAAIRFQRLVSFSEQPVPQIMEHRSDVKLKHALSVIAQENGYESWRALKASIEASGRSSSTQAPSSGREMYAAGFCGTLNRWFAGYEEAQASLEEHGGFLLPFGRQFFVCEGEGIRVLRLNPDDPDWERIARDWVNPEDQQAWLRLDEKRVQTSMGGRPSARRSAL